MGVDNKELSLVHVKDLVNGMYRAAIHPKDGEIYFLGSPEPYNWKQVAEICGDILNINCFDIAIPHSILYTAGAIGSLLERLSGRDLSLNLDRAKRITRPSWCCSSEKAMKELQYYPELSLEDGIRQTLDWYKKESWI
jgi:nucleoside-diphosphate-sugar epimerase